MLDDDGWVAPRDGARTDLYFFGYGHDYRGGGPGALRGLRADARCCPGSRSATGGAGTTATPRDEYATLIDRFAAEGIPFSVSVLDMDWHVVDVDPQYGSGWTGYSWNRELFPDPAAFLALAARAGLRVTLNVHPADGVRAFEDVYPAMARGPGPRPGVGDPIAFDVTDRAFLAAYFECCTARLERDGVDFWWIDWQSGPHSRVAGIDPLWMLNHFHFLDNAPRRQAAPDVLPLRRPRQPPLPGRVLRRHR